MLAIKSGAYSCAVLEVSLFVAASASVAYFNACSVLPTFWAEFISRYFGKGKLILIEGNIKTGSYEDKNGRMVYTTDIWVDSVSFTGEKSENNGDFRGGNNQQGNLSNNAPNTAYNAGQTAYNAGDYEDVTSDDGVPW